MEQYKEGTVFELYENDNQDYIILKNIKLNNELYLVVSPVAGDKNNLKIDTSNLILLRVDEKTTEINFVKEKDVISKVLDKIFEE